MLKLEEVLQLKDGEEIRMVTKRHVVTIVPKLLLSLLLIVGPFFFLFPLFNSGPTGIMLFAVFIAVGIIIAWRTFAMWDGDALIVSTHRVIKVTQTGIFSRTVNELDMKGVTDVSWSRKGLLGYLFNYGLVTVGTTKPFLFRQIPRPRDIHTLIMEIMERLGDKEEPRKEVREERIERVQKLVEDMDDEELRKLEQGMRSKERAEVVEELFKGTGHRAQGTEHEEEEDDEESDIDVKTLSGSKGLKPLED